MNKLFDFEKNDIIVIKSPYDKDLTTDVVIFVKKDDTEDIVGCNRGFLWVGKDSIKDDMSTVELVEVFRRDGDIFKKVY